MIKKAILDKIENGKEPDNEFFYMLQSALLLALKEKGRLNEVQFRTAADRLGTIYGRKGCSIS